MSDSEYKDPEWDNSLELKKALKLVLKYEIHCLLRRLSETGEESVVITASAAEGSASHLCSKKGEDFLQIESLDVVKHNFLSYCKVASEPSFNKKSSLENFMSQSQTAPKEQYEVSPKEQSSEEITIIEPVSIKAEPIDIDLDLDLQASELTECPQPHEQKTGGRESSQAHRVLVSKISHEKDPGKRMNESSNTLSNYYEHLLSKLNREINNEINKTKDKDIRMDVFSSGSASSATGTQGMLVESSNADLHTSPIPQGDESGLESREKGDMFNKGIGKGAFKDGVLKLEPDSHSEFVENTSVWEQSLPSCAPEKHSRPTAYCLKAAETDSAGEYRQYLPYPQSTYTSQHVTFSSSPDPDEAGNSRLVKNAFNNTFYYSSDTSYRTREEGHNQFIGNLPSVQSVKMDNVRAVNSSFEGVAESAPFHIEDTNYLSGDTVYTEMTSFASVGANAMKCLICNKHLSRSRPYYRRRHWIHHLRERAVMVEKSNNSPQRK
ncbi:hypothetical protein ACJMK2_025419 [Sinanodonta woodiana]|uniref:Uncharacterized protein n=1 Tax=Sinanodonta woodiana TaxID=1069815 RepID=A0ABD3XIU4_SINWO